MPRPACPLLASLVLSLCLAFPPAALSGGPPETDTALATASGPLFADAGPRPSFPDAAGHGQGQDATLAKTVILFRHGVRSPTQPASELEGWSARPWPQWDVPPGQLTPRGAALLRAEGATLRQSLAFQGLLSRTGCPPAGTIFAGADDTARTRDSARAMLEGLAPGCGLPSTVLPGALFHPVRGGLMPPPHPDAAAKQALARGMMQAMRRVLPGMQEIAALLGPADGPLCPPSLSPCTLDSVPSVLRFPQAGARQGITLEGGAERMAAVAEILFLECLEWPAKAQAVPVARDFLPREPGWTAVGDKTREIVHAPRSDDPDSLPLPPPPALERLPAPQSGPLLVNPQTALRLLDVHDGMKDVLLRFPDQSKAEGLPLLSLAADLLAGSSALPDADRAGLVLLAGHDTNIAAVAGVLDLHWHAPPFPADSIPPGAMLMFRLWQMPQGRVVDAAFLCQPPAALFSEDADVMAQAALTHVPLVLPGATLDTPAGKGLRLEEFLRFTASKVGAGLPERLDRLLAAPSP